MQSISPVFARALLEAIGTPREALNPAQSESNSTPQNATPVTLHELSRLINQARQCTGSDDLGLQAYDKAHPAHLGVLGYAIMSSETLGEAMGRMVEHHSLIGTGFCMFLESSATTVKIVGLSANAQNPSLPRVFVDAVAAITLGLLHWLAPCVRIIPVNAEFTYPKPADTRQLEQLFGPRLNFSCAANALVFRREDADVAVASFNPSLGQIHDQYLKRHRNELDNSNAAASTKRMILQHLHQAKPLGMAHIAQALGLSEHQLIKQLGDAGQSFRSLVDQVKKQHSHHLLMNTALSLKQITYSTGFKHPSAFNKACERWFAMAPGAYRLRR